jgi:flagellar export protein FliJ
MVRLARQAVDRERQVLQEINAAMAKIEQHIDNLAAMARSEADKGGDFMTTGATLVAFLRANKQRAKAAAEHLQNLQTVKSEQLLKLHQQRVELKRYERMAERRAKQRAEDLAAKEQRVIDELLTTKSKRRRSADG